MPIVIEHCEGGVIFKYKLDEYYNQNLNPFLQCIVGTDLLNRCSLATSTNEAYYNLAFQAKSICTLKQFLLSPSSNGYESDSSFSSSSSYSLEYSDDDEDDSSLSRHAKDDFIPNGNLFSYNQALLLMGCLSTQLSTLRRNRLTITQLNLDSIFVIDESVFIMLDPVMITSISPSGMMTFLEPILLNESSFCFPEIVNRSVFPFNCHCNCVYYNFASMLYYCMFNDYLPFVNCKIERRVLEGLKYVHLLDASSEIVNDRVISDSGDDDSSIGSISFEMVNEELKRDKDEDEDENENGSKEETIFQSQCAKMEILNGTKMYYFFKRCLDPKGDRRKLFYI